jgi:hypothetical protein
MASGHQRCQRGQTQVVEHGGAEPVITAYLRLSKNAVSAFVRFSKYWALGLQRVLLRVPALRAPHTTCAKPVALPPAVAKIQRHTSTRSQVADPHIISGHHGGGGGSCHACHRNHMAALQDVLGEPLRSRWWGSPASRRIASISGNLGVPSFRVSPAHDICPPRTCGSTAQLLGIKPSIKSMPSALW